MVILELLVFDELSLDVGIVDGFGGEVVAVVTESLLLRGISSGISGDEALLAVSDGGIEEVSSLRITSFLDFSLLRIFREEEGDPILSARALKV